MAESEIKQVIVMIKKFPDDKGGNFGLRLGKMVVQGSHAVTAFLLDMIKTNRRPTIREFAWIATGQKKICVRVNSEEELLNIHNQAMEAGLASHVITDHGLTEFTKPTITCLAIGPDESEKIDKITGHLELL